MCTCFPATKLQLLLLILLRPPAQPHPHFISIGHYCLLPLVPRPIDIPSPLKFQREYKNEGNNSAEEVIACVCIFHRRPMYGNFMDCGRDYDPANILFGKSPSCAVKKCQVGPQSRPGGIFRVSRGCRAPIGIN